MIKRRGVSVALVAVTSVLNMPLVAGRPMVPFVAHEQLERRLAPLVRQSRRSHDVVVVIVHGGVEYEREPLATQVRTARALIDAGATLVIGHHPHVLQRVERYRAGLVAYSLGNFLFDNDEEAQRETGVLRVRASREGVTSAKFVLVWIDDRPVPHPVRARGERAHQINRSMISLAVGRRPRERDEALVWE
jgi:poly-gamma-glutamate synthesis protein (capsule biosynthesis protein)